MADYFARLRAAPALPPAPAEPRPVLIANNHPSLLLLLLLHNK